MKILEKQLPSGWEWAKMGDVADVIGGGTPKTNDSSNYEGGTIPWITPADLSGYTAKHIGSGARKITKKGLDTSSAKMMPAGTVLFTSRAPVGYVAIASNPVCTNQGFKSFVLKDGLLPDYVYWWLKGSKDLAESMASGTTFLELSGAKAKQLPIPIAPLDQQKLIVAEIEKQFSRLDEAVTNLKRVKANLKRYKAAVLKAAVEGRLVETEASIARREGRSYETGEQVLQRILETRRSHWKGKGKYKEPAAPDIKNLPELPEGWIWVAAEQVCDPIASGSTPKSQDMYEGSGEIPFIKVYNLKFDSALDFSIKPTFIKRVTHEGLLNRSQVIPGDVLTNIVGPPLGKVSIVPHDYPEWNINQAIVTLRATTAIKNHLLSFWLMSAPIFTRLERTAKATAGQFNLQVTTFRKLAIPLPPISEQIRIIAEVDKQFTLINEIEEQIENNLERAKYLRQAILANSFSNGFQG